MRHIALLGKARSGKDSVAAHLVATQHYTRLAFADRLKEAALRANPFVGNVYGDDYDLKELVSEVGWEYAKEHYSEVRRFLQDFGQAMRQVDEDIWIRPVAKLIDGADWIGVPVAVTDVRYANEYHTLSGRGFLFVRMVRPGTGADRHVSETELDDYPADVEIRNTGSLQALYDTVDRLPLD